MKCNLCGLTKPSHAFSPARQTARDYSTWRCKDCDFPAYSSCGAIPTQPKHKPYICVLCVNSHLALAKPSDLSPSNIASRRSRLGNAKRAGSEHSRNVWMQQAATAASLQMTKHLRLFLCIDMLVWLESFRPVTSAETCVIHLVMLFRWC